MIGKRVKIVNSFKGDPLENATGILGCIGMNDDIGAIILDKPINERLVVMYPMECIEEDTDVNDLGLPPAAMASLNTIAAEHDTWIENKKQEALIVARKYIAGGAPAFKYVEVIKQLDEAISG